MLVAFYIAAVVAVAATIRVITCTNAVHALLYLILSLLSVAVIFYTLGAPFAATLEVIVYAGAIMVLFVFVVMMLNLNEQTIARERSWLRPRAWIGPGLLALILLAVMAFTLAQGRSMGTIDGAPLDPNKVGALIYGPYVLLVELAAFVLLSALVVAAHIGREDRDVERALAEREPVATRRPRTPGDNR